MRQGTHWVNTHRYSESLMKFLREVNLIRVDPYWWKVVPPGVSFVPP